jgi:hypothetical protein
MLATWPLVAGLAATLAQDSSPVNPPVQLVPMSQISAASSVPGTVVIGSLPEPGHGHVVAVVPGTDRVWDGNILGGFVDLVNGRNPALAAFRDIARAPDTDAASIGGAAGAAARSPDTNLSVIRKMNLVVNGGKSGPLDVTTMTPDQLRAYAEEYIRNGAQMSISWRRSAIPSVVWYQAPTDQDVTQVVRNYQPPPAANSSMLNLRCNDLIQKAAPVVQQLVMDESAPGKNVQVPYVSANEIDKALWSLRDTSQPAATPAVQPPPPPPQAPIYSPTPMQMNVIPKPGGVLITATAEIEGLRPDEVASAAYETRAGELTLRLRSGSAVSCKLDPDDFAIAVRCAFQNEVDPALSMEYSKKPGYHEVHYCGPLFETKFGETLYRTDHLLGELIFNEEGTNRSVAADLIPGYRELVCEARGTMSVGCRVFLRATAARFRVERGRLACREVETKVDVEGLRYASSYYQESFHRMARMLDENRPLLVETFEEFQDLDRLAQCVALAKWLKRNAIPFDWSELASRTVALKKFPAYSPSVDWHSLFNGRNLDGWRIDLPSQELDWSRKGDSITVRPTGRNSASVLSQTWYDSYDLRYSVITKGPVGASVSLDTKGKAGSVELYMVKGKWTAIAPELGRSGQVAIPEPKKDEPRKPNVYGIRVPPGSRLTLFAASFRGGD